MSLTDYQAKYFAHELTRRFPPDSVERITATIAGAQVDMNPHQIDAAFGELANQGMVANPDDKTSRRKKRYVHFGTNHNQGEYLIRLKS